MLYSENELQKRLKNGCGLFCFYAVEEALVLSAARKTMDALPDLDPERTTLPGPTPAVEELVMAAGTISFFGGRRLIYLPLLRPAGYTDRDLKDITDTFAAAENTVFVLTCVFKEKRGSVDLSKREQNFISACEKLGYCVQINRPSRPALQGLLESWAGESGARFAQGAAKLLIERCGEDQFLLRGEVEKLAALSGYGLITGEMAQQLSTVTLDADTFAMVRMLTAGDTAQALEKLGILLAQQTDPLLITGALTANYIDMYRMHLADRSRRNVNDVMHDFSGYKNSYGLEKLRWSAKNTSRSQIERSLAILWQLDRDLKRSRLDKDILLQKAMCELALARSLR